MYIFLSEQTIDYLIRLHGIDVSIDENFVNKINKLKDAGLLLQNEKFRSSSGLEPMGFMVRKIKTAALLELTGPWALNDNKLKQTFKYYWQNSSNFGIPFERFSIFNTNGKIENNISLLNCLYNCGYRVFVGFSRSTIVAGVLDWFNAHPDAVGISATSTAYSLVVKKNIYRMTTLDNGIEINLEKDIEFNPKLSVYYMYLQGDFYSADFLKSFQANPIIGPRLIVCTFVNKITKEILNDYLKNSKPGDFIVNGMANIDFLTVFENPGYSVIPYIYDSIGTDTPELTPIQSKNLKGKYSYFSYQGVNTSYLWHLGKSNLKSNFAPQAFDILQVQTQLVKNYSPDYLEGASGILQFDPTTKDRIYFSVSREDFLISEKWVLNALIFNDPLLGQFVANKLNTVNRSIPLQIESVVSDRLILERKTAALLNLTGTGNSYLVDVSLKNTFEYYWNNRAQYNLSFKNFPIYDTMGMTGLILYYLNQLYNDGYRIFIGFSTSSELSSVISWFNEHPDAIGISPFSTSVNLSIKKNVYRMSAIDNGPENPIITALKEDISSNPSLAIYYLLEIGDNWSEGMLNSLKQTPQISNRLIVCPFKNSITAQQLDNYLINSKKGDFLVNGLIKLDLFNLFSVPNYTIKPHIYYNTYPIHPEFNQIQSTNLKGNISVFVYQGVNTSYLWRKGLEDLKDKFGPQAFDILQVQTQLEKDLKPEYQEGAAGILEFDPITKDRMYFSFVRENFTVNNEWKIISLVFQDPIYGDFIANKI